MKLTFKGDPYNLFLIFFWFLIHILTVGKFGLIEVCDSYQFSEKQFIGAPTPICVSVLLFYAAMWE